jgi:hypothetical protein
MTVAVGTCEGCLDELTLFDRAAGYRVCFACTKARHAAVVRRRCPCGPKRRPVERDNHLGRRWIACERCLGFVRQLT